MGSSNPCPAFLPPLKRGSPARRKMKRDDPEQFIAIGYLDNTLVSVIYEVRYDEQGEYIWLITYWKSTKKERQIYEQYFY